MQSTPVMQTLLRIGNILLCKGESKKSLDCFNEVLGIGYASDSVNAIEVANALYGKGCAQFCDFHLTEAMKSFSESLNWKLAALGENNPGLACIFYQMAHVYLEQSEHEEAITCFEEYKRLQKLEPQRNLHDNAEICYAEGIVAKLKGRQDAALSFYNQALAMFDTLFGGDHEKVASIHVSSPIRLIQNHFSPCLIQSVRQFDIGCILSAMSNYEVALVHFQTCLIQRRKLLGSHVDVANTLYEMASIYSGTDRTGLAMKCLVESDEIWKTKLQNNEQLTSVLLLSAKLWKSIQCYQQAEENLEQALHHAISIYGQQHETVASILLSLGELLQEINQIQQALFCFDESIQVRTALYGPDSPSVAQVEYTKGVALLFHGDFAEASYCLDRALTIRQEKLGPMDGTVGDTLNTIGFLQLRMGNVMNDEALNPLTNALAIRRAVGNNGKVISTLQNIASLYKKRKHHDSWIGTHAEILIVQQEEFGCNDAKVADAWISLGNTQMSAGRLEEATVSFEEALRIQTLINGYNHKSVAQVLFKIGSLNSRQNNFTNAKQLFEEYMRIRAEEVDDPDEEMAQALTLMGDLQKETGEKSKAQINWTSALEIYQQLGYPEDHPRLSKLRTRQKTGGPVFGFPMPRRMSGDFSVLTFFGGGGNSTHGE
jgi:tetratricopeptide (TPR) repeat protein